MEEEILYLLEGIALVFVIREHCWNIPLPPNPGILITFYQLEDMWSTEMVSPCAVTGAVLTWSVGVVRALAFRWLMKLPVFPRFQSLFSCTWSYFSVAFWPAD